MSISTAMAQWQGTLKEGNGNFKLGSGSWSAPYSFKTRFEGAQGTSPEELIAAAHASCFAMALAAGLEQAGYPARAVDAQAKVKLEAVSGGFAITEITIEVEGIVPGIDEARFQAIAAETKQNCPVSKALASVKITLASARLTA